MSHSWEAVERRAAKKARITAPGAGEFAESIGAGMGDVHVDDPDFGETAEDRRFDELVEVLGRRVSAGEARQLARDVMALDGRKDRDIAADVSAATGAVWGVSVEERLAGKFRGLFFEVKNAARPVLQLRVVLMALGWADERVDSMRKCAADYQLSTEAVSNMVAAVQARHQLPKSHFNKSDEMVATYRRSNARA